jgi:regulator of protease activity HflC (stomatin/prohibitin superfamily)
MGEQMIREKQANALPGVVMLVLFLALEVFSIWYFVDRILAKEFWTAGGASLLFIIAFIGFFGLTPVSPNESRVMQLLGTYAGTIHQAGFWWVNPFSFPRRRVSLRIRNFESAKLKVNDHDGNPIEIAAIVVWRVTETAEAVFQVDDYENFVKVQSEAAVRNLATTYPYDAHAEGALSLRTSSQEITERMRTEIQERLSKAGIEVIEARISHLAYAPEIAQAMLRRQQASAVVAARTRIVEGAVGMVEMALEELGKRGVVELDEERKAAMVSNLLVVLCSEHNTQPVVNTGTLYT